MPSHAFTIAKLASTVGVGVEAVRYYQSRGLLATPERSGGFREYSTDDVARLQFIKRAQELGFSLDDIAELVSLSAEKNQLLVREITQQRVAEIRQRVERLEAMAAALQELVSCCEHSSRHDRCPIIDALVGIPVAEVVPS